MKDKTNKKTERKDTFRLEGHNMNSLKNLSVDDVVTLEIKAKLTRKEEGSYPSICDCDVCTEERKDSKNKVVANFEIMNVKSKGVNGNKYSSKEANVASKYSELIKKGVSPSVAMKRAMKG